MKTYELKAGHTVTFELQPTGDDTVRVVEPAGIETRELGYIFRAGNLYFPVATRNGTAVSLREPGTDRTAFFGSIRNAARFLADRVGTHEVEI